MQGGIMLFVILSAFVLVFIAICLISSVISDRNLKKKLGTVEIIQVGQFYAVRVFGYRAHSTSCPVRLMPSESATYPEWLFVDINGNMAYTPSNHGLTKSAQFETFIDANKAAEQARYFASKMKVPGSAGTPDLTVRVAQTESLCDALVVQRNGKNL